METHKRHKAAVMVTHDLILRMPSTGWRMVVWCGSRLHHRADRGGLAEPAQPPLPMSCTRRNHRP